MANMRRSRLRSLPAVSLNFWRGRTKKSGQTLPIDRGDSDALRDVEGKLHVTRFHSHDRDVEEALVAEGDVPIDLHPFRARCRELVI